MAPLSTVTDTRCAIVRICDVAVLCVDTRSVDVIVLRDDIVGAVDPKIFFTVH